VTAQQVIELIENAFAGVRRDPEQSLHQAQLDDQAIAREISPEERSRAGLLDDHDEWHEVSEAELQECPDAMSHFLPDSWCFYLPAYMRAAIALLDKPLWKADLPHRVLFALTYRNDSAGIGRYYLDRFERLDEAQCEAVWSFLIFVANSVGEHNFSSRDATEALQSYWALPLEKRPNSALLTDTSTSPLRAPHGAAKRGR
jgi:hypothetical protein